MSKGVFSAIRLRLTNLYTTIVLRRVFSMSLKPVRFQRGGAQSPLNPFGSIPASARQCTGNLQGFAAKVIDRMLQYCGHPTPDGVETVVISFDLAYQPD
ncbi:hypothetical protein [Pseudomonas fluorescens]|uniref:hypothetical protein n=1 Tax=Pseudomonas fluorescens TaxID=294 RepID=UPI00123F2149|nr:hypothetical protein [Pseudomonas fluorescens]